MTALDNALAKLKQRQELQILEQLQLPMWPDQRRGVPNGLLRSSLFGAISLGGREFLERTPMEAVEGVTIIYTGKRLCQLYLELWENLVHVAREQQLGNRCEVTVYQILKLLKKQDTGGNRQVLRRQLAVLQATTIEMRQGRYTYSGSLIEKAFHDELTRRVVIILDPRIVALFQNDGYTAIAHDIKSSLNRPLAKWLFGFYSSHRQPFAYSVAKLHALCGSRAKSLKHFEEATLADALDEVASVTRANGEYFDFAIQRKKRGESLVHVSRMANIKAASRFLPE